MAYWNQAKLVDQKLAKITQEAKQLNSYEETLGFPKTDLTEIAEMTDEFEKYFALWQFVAEKWQFSINYYFYCILG